MAQYTRRHFLEAAAAGAACALLPAHGFGAAPPAKGPNFIFILTDDQGWGDAKGFGHPYVQTPNLDRLAQSGTWFQQFYVNGSVCSPSRTAFMTGHYPARHGVHGHFADAKQNADRGMPNWLDPDTTTVCDSLGAGGYATAHFGKWHLGHGEGAPGPGTYGIEDHRTVNSSGPGWDAQHDDPYFRAHSTDLFVDETIRFIRSSVAAGRPFYVNLWTLVPHALLKPTPEELAVYEGLEVKPEDFPAYMRDYVRDAKDMTAQMKVFCAALTGLDKSIGRLLDFLDEAGLAENTVVFMSSDNGPEDYHIRNAANAGMGAPGAFRGRKRSLYEGGVRTPFVARWPGKIAAGRVDNTSVLSGVDFLPTLCGLAGVALPEIAPDGEDRRAALLDGPQPRTKPIYWEWRFRVAGNPAYAPPCLAVRDGQWKFFMDAEGGRQELYDVVSDPEERNNVIEQHRETAARLAAALAAWKKTLPE